MKKLEFNQNKCVKLHISKAVRKGCSQTEPNTRNVRGAFLEVQECEIKEDEEERYIGDVIFCNGSNDGNISRRRSLGTGAIAQIFAILSEVSLGFQYIEIGLIPRESILMLLSF